MRCYTAINFFSTAAPRSKSASGYEPLGPNQLADMDPPSADLDLPTELSANIILNILAKIDNTLRFSAY